jgi:hypothetical protein
MTVNLNLWKDLSDNSIFADDKGCALDAEAELSVKGLFLVNAIDLCHLFFRVGQKRHVQMVLIPEFSLFAHAVSADPDYNCATCFDLSFRIAELRCFARSTGSVRLGIEEENHRIPSGKMTQLDYLAMIVQEHKVWGLAAFFNHKILRASINVPATMDYSGAAQMLPVRRFRSWWILSALGGPIVPW